METQTFRWMPKELSRNVKIIMFGVERRASPLEDIIGIIKLEGFNLSQPLIKAQFFPSPNLLQPLSKLLNPPSLVEIPLTIPPFFQVFL
ncbi:hypothetical protein DRN69_03480 [Candidatus Pacearchaeota archaeon]|nr:MAG: hypothetical protein DRN69_03480 [Candidatus Pacearchaeota archaeon]